MASPSCETVELFVSLATHCEVGAGVLSAVASGEFRGQTELRTICTVSGFPQTRAGDVERFLEISCDKGLFKKCSALTWAPTNTDLHRALAPLLLGAALYRKKVHRDADVVQVVLTKPPAPSQMANQLDRMLKGSWGLLDTQSLLPLLAESSSEDFVIMTPYLDTTGAPVVLNLFERVEQRAERTLILRETEKGQMQPGLATITARLKALNVQVLNFRLGRIGAEGNETFHAKVVLADRHSAYVGSSNMNKWSFQYSLELGLHVKGQAASRIADVVSAVKEVSLPVEI